ncbi:OST-HTH/LOTUS domain-containing protein [Neglectibacter timonensis]|uniref:OST-HTH/LOTUS domain-containing protein n=1 Tax=Neglectibacter timonensis TaxID=1776382 RepID=UPI003F59B905
MFVGKVGNLLGKRYPDFDVRNFGFSKLTPFLDSLDMFETKSERKGDNSSPQIYIRLK